MSPTIVLSKFSNMDLALASFSIIAGHLKLQVRRQPFSPKLRLLWRLELLQARLSSLEIPWALPLAGSRWMKGIEYWNLIQWQRWEGRYQALRTPTKGSLDEPRCGRNSPPPLGPPTEPIAAKTNANDESNSCERKDNFFKIEIKVQPESADRRLQ